MGLDVDSLLARGLGEISDSEVLRIAKSENRIVITLDRDFLEPYLASGKIDYGVNYLDLPAHLRYISGINGVLERFFRTHANSVDMEHSVVIIRQYDVLIDTAR